jgi:hypothetical protein
MAHYPLRDIGETSPHDPLELTEAAELHIMLLPSDQACAPAGERDSADLTGPPALMPPSWTGGTSDGPFPRISLGGSAGSRGPHGGLQNVTAQRLHM